MPIKIPTGRANWLKNTYYLLKVPGGHNQPLAPPPPTHAVNSLHFLTFMSDTNIVPLKVRK